MCVTINLFYGVRTDLPKIKKGERDPEEIRKTKNKKFAL